MSRKLKIRIANIIEESFVDGEGIRFAIFVQGCFHNCKDCHNPSTHDFNGGKILDTEDIISKFKRAPLISGITLSGGEPLCQIKAVTELAAAAQNAGLSVWCYTGSIYENLIEDLSDMEKKFFTLDDVNQFLKYVNVLVDGPFIESQRDLTMSFCGSRNQRIIDVQKSRDQKKIILWKSY